jgi:anti-sigma factor RsiW
MTCQQLVELVTDYLDGALNPATAHRFQAHLDACDGCVAHLEQMRLTLRLLGRIPVGSLDRQARDRLRDAFRTWSAFGA